ncbi:MAG: THUMP domain-containing protein [Methanotrichaceae archaeon]|nr:THUMP domain-containing protein [Methanotrichaceae archaeon]
MKTYAFELSGEHETLPRSEALALTEVYSSKHREVCLLDQCLLVEAEGLDFKALGRRLAMAHSIIEVMVVCEARLEDLAEAVTRIDIPSNSYRIRAKRVKQAAMPGDAVEKEVGRILFRRGFRADLKSPEIKLRAVITGDKIVLGQEIACPDRSGFESRRPHLKPFFHPGVLMPRMARALVNLSQAMPGERLLDPFAGTGGILVEACLIGIKGIGIDVQKRLIRGARANIACLDCSLMTGDAKRLPFKDKSIDAAVLDTPYGRSALIEARSKEALLDESLAELHRVLKLGRRMVIVSDRPIEVQVSAAGFEIIQKHFDRVHRSLTRHIFVCER